MRSSREEKLIQHNNQLKESVAKKQREAGYPNARFKSSNYDSIEKKYYVDMFANEAIRPTFYKHKLHVSLDLENDADYQKVWEDVVLEIFKEPSVHGVKLINPQSDKDKRQPGKEITLYFHHPTYINPKMAESALVAEHLKVMQKLDSLIQQAGVKASQAPTNKGVPEFSTLELGCKTGAIYISPPDFDESGKYIDSENRETGDHPYTAEYTRQQKMSLAERKLDYVASKMPILENAQQGTLSKDKPFKNLVRKIRETSNEDATLDDLATLAGQDNNLRSKTGLFARKSTESSDLVKGLSGLLKDVKKNSIGYVDFKTKVDNIINKLADLNPGQVNAQANRFNSNN